MMVSETDLRHMWDNLSKNNRNEISNHITSKSNIQVGKMGYSEARYALRQWDIKLFDRYIVSYTNDN